jgi:hypothetical protein
MSRRSRSKGRSTNWLAPIVIGLVMGGIAYAVSDGTVPLFGTAVPTSTPGRISTTVEAPMASSSTFEVGIRLPTEDRDLRVLVDPNTREVTPIEVAKAWRVEQLDHQAQGLRFASSEERGFRLTDGKDWNVALRSLTGEAYVEPRLLGTLDERHALVVARSDKVYLLNVARSGGVSVVTDIPANTNIFGMSGGAVWAATFTPGEGLESEPTGPSTLIRITPNGQSQVVDSTKTADLFMGVVSDGENRATWLNTGVFTGFINGKTFSGMGMPLAWIDGTLIVAEDRDLVGYDKDGKKIDLGIRLEGVPASARAAE